MGSILLFLVFLAAIFMLSNRYRWAAILFRIVLGTVLGILAFACVYLVLNIDKL